MRRKVHYVIKPEHLWANIVHLARTQNGELLDTLQEGFKYIEEESFQSNFQGLFSEINLGSDKLGQDLRGPQRQALLDHHARSPRGWREFSTDTDTLGDAYEYLIGQFAAGLGQEGGRVLHAAADLRASSRPSSRSTARSRRPASGSGWRACSTSPAARARCC